MITVTGMVAILATGALVHKWERLQLVEPAAARLGRPGAWT